MNSKVIEGLDICYKTANILKSSYPNELMKISPNDTILAFSKDTARRAQTKGMGKSYAFYHRTTHRVIIKQKCLSERIMYRTKVKNQGDRVKLYGNWAIVELMAHELAHHRTKGHAKGFKIKYNKFVNHMAQSVMSGEFYK
jgi:hypothetical protein